MKAELVYNTEEKPRVLLTLESFEEHARMAYEPNLDIVSVEESTSGPTKMAFAIVPSYARERHANGDIQPLSTAERKNPAHAMGGGKSEADYQRFIERYEATVEELLDECIKRDGTIAEIESMGAIKDIRRAEAAHQAYRGETQSLLRELATIFGPLKPRKGMNRNASILAQIGEHLTKADDLAEELYGVLEKVRAESENDKCNEMDSLLTCVNLAADALEARVK
jgi:hypothetical protein